MVNENYPVEIPKTYTVAYLNEEIQLPKLSEIADKDGKVELPSELVAKLRDPNARFRIDSAICPMWSEEWEDLEVSCMAAGCGNTYVNKWKHGNCYYSYPSNIQWSTHANLKCSSCGTIADISRWRFICHGSGCTEETTDLITLTDVVSALLEYPGANRQFASRFLKSAKEIFNR